MFNKDTLVGTPDPEDNRTPQEKFDQHQVDIRRDAAGAARQRQEFVAAADAGPAVVLAYIHNQQPAPEQPENG